MADRPADQPADQPGPQARTGDDAADAHATAAEWERRRRRAEIFGEALPDTTRDERGDRRSDVGPDRESATDRWLKSQVPPPHGG